MAIITANNCEMYYEVDDGTDPWLKNKEATWLQQGVGFACLFLTCASII